MIRTLFLGVDEHMYLHYSKIGQVIECIRQYIPEAAIAVYCSLVVAGDMTWNHLQWEWWW